MNKQLRYMTHILAILLMASSMQSLMANTVWFSNESDEQIEAKIIVDTWEKPVHLSISPYQHNVVFRTIDCVDREYRDQIKDDQFLIHTIVLMVDNDNTRLQVYTSAQKKNKKKDIKVVYWGNSKYQAYFMTYLGTGGRC